MLYSGAKGTMTPDNRLQRTALPPPLNRNVSLPDGGHSRPGGRGPRAGARGHLTRLGCEGMRTFSHSGREASFKHPDRLGSRSI
jgi:hypothetical protein